MSYFFWVHLLRRLDAAIRMDYGETERSVSSFMVEEAAYSATGAGIRSSLQKYN